MLNLRENPEGGLLLAIKAVPGARRDQVVGVLGDRLKIRVVAPPEGGKANRAICELVASSLGLRPADVEVIQGHTSATKTLLIRGVPIETVIAKWSE